MLLAINIGNTNINYKLFSGRREDKKIIICSVVPKTTASVEKMLRKFGLPKPLIIGKDIIVPMKNYYRNPKKLGQDRLVNAYAAFKLYGALAIVIDLGTAITFDVVSSKGEYLGGMIFPGLQVCLDALSAKTALLPKIKLEIPAEFIGRDTKAGILSGAVYGIAALIDGLVKKIKKEIGAQAKVIATGGNAKFIGRYYKFDKIDPDLTLKGINFFIVLSPRFL